MLQNDFEDLVKTLCLLDNLPQVLDKLKQHEDSEIAEAAQSLTGQFAVAEVAGEQRIYHVTIQQNEAGEEQEYVEHVMNEGDDIIRFVAWFFSAMFDVRLKESYRAAGKSYKQPKR